MSFMDSWYPTRFEKSVCALNDEEISNKGIVKNNLSLIKVNSPSEFF